jgi:hypothetical protein
MYTILIQNNKGQWVSDGRFHAVEADAVRWAGKQGYGRFFVAALKFSGDIRILS